MDKGISRLLVILSFVFLVGVGVFFFFYYNREPLSVPEKEPETKESPNENPKEASEGLPPLIDDSIEKDRYEPTDAQLSEWASFLSSNPLLANWIKNQDLLGKFVALVETISTGQSPRELLDFLGPEGRFETIERGEQEFINPVSYRRYDGLVNAFASLDADKCARLIKRLYMWMERRYQEMAKPGRHFQDALFDAIVELLRVPVVEEEILLARKEVICDLFNPKLEGMSDAQKHLFRMGPDNIRKVQKKLREIGDELGFTKKLEEVTPISLDAMPGSPP